MNIQRSLTHVLLIGWSLVVCIGILGIGPKVHFTYGVPLLGAYVITAIGAAIVTGLLNIMPLMLGMGVLLYHKQWKKAETRSVTLQSSIYKSYLLTLVRPFLFQMICFMPGLFVVGYLLEKGEISEVLSGVWPIFYGYIITFVFGVVTRIGLEYFKQWEMKRSSNH